jgi:hypothetical protein
LFNVSFLRDTFERCFATFCQGFVGAMAIPGPNWSDSLKIASVAAIIALAKAVAATRVGDSRSASLVE